MAMKTILCRGAALTAAFLCGALCMYIYSLTHLGLKMYRINEPLLIDATVDGRYILPKGTVLYYDHSMPEGFDVYWTPFNHKGRIDMEEVPLEPKHRGKLIIPQWLINMDELEETSPEANKTAR